MSCELKFHSSILYQQYWYGGFSELYVYGFNLQRGLVAASFYCNTNVPLCLSFTVQIMDVFARTSLEAHNKFRSAHNVPPLSWSNELARGAQIWAKKLAKEGGLKHDQLKGIGENVFMASQGFDAAAEEATETWYSEVNQM